MACAECYNQKMSCKTTDREPSGRRDEREEDMPVEKVQSENKHGEDVASTPRKPRRAAIQARERLEKRRTSLNRV